jgi:hypothetical protein
MFNIGGYTHKDGLHKTLNFVDVSFDPQPTPNTSLPKHYFFKLTSPGINTPYFNNYVLVTFLRPTCLNKSMSFAYFQGSGKLYPILAIDSSRLMITYTTLFKIIHDSGTSLSVADQQNFMVALKSMQYSLISQKGVVTC